jgi:hypothetical protein
MITALIPDFIDLSLGFVLVPRSCTDSGIGTMRVDSPDMVACDDSRLLGGVCTCQFVSVALKGSLRGPRFILIGLQLRVRFAPAALLAMLRAAVAPQ